MTEPHLLCCLGEGMRSHWTAVGLWTTLLLSQVTVVMQHSCGDNNNVVCNTLHKVNSNEIIKDYSLNGERLYCECKDPADCPQGWSDRPSQTITWYHYARRDWQVQYQFCGDVTTRIPRCTMASEIVLIMETDSSVWRPTLKQFHCHCPDNIYFLHSWRLNSTTNSIQKSVWYYNYVCYQRNCKHSEPCLKHYLDHGGSTTMGYQFLCSCPYGQHCPIGDEDHRIQSYEADGSDDTGPFILGHCVDIPVFEENKLRDIDSEA